MSINLSGFELAMANNLQTSQIKVAAVIAAATVMSATAVTVRTAADAINHIAEVLPILQLCMFLIIRSLMI